jgi:ankyrin repeat protein
MILALALVLITLLLIVSRQHWTGVAVKLTACRPVQGLEKVQSFKSPGRELTERIFDLTRRGEVGAVRLYLHEGYTPNAVNLRGDSLLILAAYKGHAEIVRLLLSEPGVEVDFRNGMGFTALSGAAFKGETEIMGQLVEAGADVNAEGAGGKTGLMFAVLTGRFDATKLLLGRGASKSVVDINGNTAETLARGQGAGETTRLVAHP